MRIKNYDKEQIIQEVSKSSWQPKFEFTDNLDAAVDSILKPHEDYFLGLHDKVKEIIEREIGVANSEELIDFGNGVYQITFADISNWQKQLFEHKKFKISQLVTLKQYGDIDDIIANRVENLEWCTPKENMAHKFQQGYVPRGVSRPYSKTLIQKQLFN